MLVSLMRKAVAKPMNGNVSNNDRRLDNSGRNINKIAVTIAMKSRITYIDSPTKVFGSTITEGKKDANHTFEIEKRVSN